MPREGSPREGEASAPATGGAPNEAGNPGVVLLVEDHDDVRRVTARILVKAGFVVIEAVHGRHALQLAARGSRIDVIVSDYSMPGMNGVELIERLTELLGPLPTILTSGYADQAIIARALENPAVTFLPKPSSPAALVAAVRAAVGSWPRGDAAPG